MYRGWKKRKKTLRSLATLILSIVMLTSLVPIAVFAYEEISGNGELYDGEFYADETAEPSYDDSHVADPDDTEIASGEPILVFPDAEEYFALPGDDDYAPSEGQPRGDFAVTLMIGDEPFAELTSGAGLTITENGYYFDAPQPAPDVGYWPAGAVSFRGWFRVPGPGENELPFDFDGLFTENMRLYAEFSNLWLITFKYEGQVVETRRVEPGTPVLNYHGDVPIVPPDGQRLRYWYVESDHAGGAVPVQFIFGSPATRDITLVPFFSDEFVVFFISAGTQVEPGLVTGGGVAVEPAAPTRAGYIFSHWSAEDGGAPYDFSTPVTENDLFLYAVWTPREDIAYTVVYWVERPNFSGTPTPGNAADYIYAFTETRTGVAGELTDVTGISAAAAASSETLRYSTFQFAVNAPILGNGTTVVNAYCARNTFNITFNLSYSQGGTTHNTTMEFNGNTYRAGRDATIPYSIAVKYEQDVSAIWPCEGTATFTNSRSGFRFTGWSVSYSDINSSGTGASITWVTKRLVITEDMLPATPGAAGYTINATWANNPTLKTANYWLEALPGQDTRGLTTSVQNNRTYVLSERYSQTFYFNGNLSAKEIEGMIYVSGNSGASDTTEYNFYYNRRVATLSFDAMGGSQVESVSGIMFEQSLADMTPVDPTRVTDGVEFIFMGWYLEPQYYTEFDFETATMPASSLRLFARWEAKAFTVTFFDDLTRNNVIGTRGKVGNETLLPGESPFFPGQRVEGRGTFDSWFMFIGNTGHTMRFSFETPITRDIELHAVWLVEGFTVTYSVGEGTGTPPSDAGEYHLGKETRVKEPIGAGYAIVPPDSMRFIGWREENTGMFYYPGMIVALLGDAHFTARFISVTEYEEKYVNITYLSNFPGTDKPEERYTWAYETGSMALLAPSTLFSYRGYSITGWRDESSDALYSPGEMITVGADDVVLHAVWDFSGWTVTFDPGNHGSLAQGAERVFTEISGGTLWEEYFDSEERVIPVPMADRGYYFVGWDAEIPHAIESDLVFIALYEAQIPVTITANDHSKVYGERDPLLSASVLGLTEWDDDINFSLVREQGEDVGIYMINVVFDINPKYDVTVRAGTFEITPAILVLAANSYIITEGDEIPEFSAYVHPDYPLVGGDTTLLYSLYRRSDSTSAGEYEIHFNINEGDNPNYDIRVVPGLLTILPRSVPPTNEPGTQPGDGDGTGTQPGDGDGTGTQPGDSDGTGTQPGDGDGTGTQPGDGDGTGAQPGDSDGTGTQPGDSDGTGAQPGDSDGTGTQPGDGDGTGTQPGGGATAIISAGPAGPAPADAPPPIITVPGEPTPATTVPRIEIVDDPQTPLLRGMFDFIASWALWDLLLSIFVLMLTVLIIIKMFRGNGKKGGEDEFSGNSECSEDENAAGKHRRILCYIMVPLLALASVIIFITNQDMSLQMVMTDQWTLLHAVLAAAALLSFLMADKKSKRKPVSEQSLRQS